MQPESRPLSEEGPPVVFVAEADSVHRRRLMDACRELGAEAVEVSHGIHAWKVLQKVEPDLIIASWALPEISGVGLLNLVRSDERLAETPFALTSGKLKKDQVVEAGRAGVSDIFVMPMPVAEASGKIAELLAAEEDAARKQAQALWGRGLELMEQERYEEALESLERIIGVYEHAEVYFNLGYIRAAQEQYQEAIHYFRKATQINQEYAKAFRMMGQCYEKLGQAHHAQSCYQKAAALFMERDMDSSAEEALKEALRVAPETINIYNTLGIIYRKRGEFRRAAECYRRAMKVSPKDENVYYNLARMYYEAGDLFLAKEILDEALLLNPGFGHAQDLLRVVSKKLAGAQPPG
jgi:tetratricopeptide (TPR) repeat protein